MASPRIAFALHLSEMLNHYLPVIQHLPAPVMLVNCARTGSAEFRRIQERSAEHGYAHVTFTEAKNDPFDVLVSNQMHVAAWENETTPGLLALAKTQVRLCYALGKTEWNLADWNKFYDLILCYGPYQQRLFKHGFAGVQVEAIGYPRFDRFFAKDNGVKALKSQFAHDAKKQNIVWLPTYNTLSSIPAFAAAISALSAQYNVWVKLHPGTPAQEPERLALLRSLPFTALITDDFDNIPLFALADVVLADYGGSAFGAIYTDKNLLLLNTHGDLLAPDTGWLSADIQLRDAFANVNPEDAEQLPALLANASLWKKQKPLRAKYRSLLFSDKNGESGKAAANAILDFVVNLKKKRKKQIAPRSISHDLLAFEARPPTKGYDWRGFYLWVKQRLQQADTEKLAVSQTINQLQQESATVQAQQGAMLKAEQQRVAEQAHLSERLRTELAAEQQRMGEQTQLSERLRTELATEQQRMAEQTQLSERLRAELATEQQRMGEQTQLSERLRTELATEQQRMAEQTQLSERLRAELAAEQQRMAEQTQLSQSLRTELGTEQQRVAEQQKIAMQLQTDLANERLKLEAMTTALTEATSHVQKLTQNIEALEHEHRATCEQLEQTNTTLARIRRRIETRIFGRIRNLLYPLKKRLLLG